MLEWKLDRHVRCLLSRALIVPQRWPEVDRWSSAHVSGKCLSR
jgi:hypothetical protein